MAIHYSGTTIGTLTLCQKAWDYANGEVVDKKDENGKQVWNKFKIQIRLSNCLATFIHVRKIDNPTNPKYCWEHQLVMFFCDERHLKACIKNYKKDAFKGLFAGELRNIKLNMYYKDMQTLMKYMVRDGLQVKCYYKKPKES